MPQKLQIVVCQNFREELAAVLKDMNQAEVYAAVADLPCAIASKPGMASDPEIARACPESTHAVVLGGACLRSWQTPSQRQIGLLRHQEPQCLFMLAPGEMILGKQAEGGFVITPGWLAQWEKNLGARGLEGLRASEIFRQNQHKLVLLDTGVHGDCRASLQAMAEHLGVGCEVVPAGLDLFRTMVQNLVLRWAPERAKPTSRAEKEPSVAGLDDLAMAFDLVSRLANVESEEEALASMSELFTMLFAPGALSYHPMPPAAAAQEAGADLCEELLSKGHVRLGSGRGFRALVRHGGELFGVLEADDLAFPSFLDRYLNLVPLVAQTCGLAISNARAQQGQLRAEEASRREQERFRLAFSTSPDAINITRLDDGLYVEVNQGFTKLTGFTQEDVIGRTVHEIDIWVDPAARQTLIRGLQEAGFVENLEAEFRRKDGSLATALVSARVIMLEGVAHIISITRDISERIRADEEKAQLEAQLRQAQKMEAIGTLAGGIAHDFNNLLASIMGYAEMAHDDAQSGQTNPHDLAQIIRSAHRGKELVQQILAFSRKKNSNLRSLDLNQIVGRVRKMLDRTLPKMIAIETHLAAELPPVLADAVQLEQVLLNLAANARDVMPDGGRLVLETRQVIFDEEDCRNHREMRSGTYALLMVADTGEGISPEIRERIFEPFFTTKGVGKGTGLGLSSAYGIVNSHGGYIHCFSEIGMGTTFRIYLPVHRVEPAASTDEMHTQEVLPGGRETVLLVDDDEALRQIGARILKRLGYRVQSAGSGEEALEKYQAGGSQPDLVIMDLGMPGMGGHKATKAMLTLNPKAKVLITSGYSANAQVREALESGAAGYVAKPYKRAELLAMVRNVLDGK
jgi:PAS domain S-box-containing protein